MDCNLIYRHIKQWVNIQISQFSIAISCDPVACVYRLTGGGYKDQLPPVVSQRASCCAVVALLEEAEDRTIPCPLIIITSLTSMEEMYFYEIMAYWKSFCITLKMQYFKSLWKVIKQEPIVLQYCRVEEDAWGIVHS